MLQTWRKFGQAAQDLPSGPDLATTQVADDVFLTLATNKEARANNFLLVATSCIILFGTLCTTRL